MWPFNVAAATVVQVINLTDTVILDAAGGGPTDSRAAFVMGADGITYREIGETPVRTAINPPDWIDPAIGVAQFEVMVTSVGDPLAAGSSALATWLDMGTERIWIIERTSGGSGQTQAVLTTQVRRISDPGTILDTADYTINATFL